MTAGQRLLDSLLERAQQRIDWARARLAHGTLSGAELEIEQAQLVLAQAPRVLQVESDRNQLELFGRGPCSS